MNRETSDWSDYLERARELGRLEGERARLEGIVLVQQACLEKMERAAEGEGRLGKTNVKLNKELGRLQKRVAQLEREAAARVLWPARTGDTT